MKKRVIVGLAALGLVFPTMGPSNAAAVSIPLSSCQVTASTPVKSSQQVRGTVTVTCTIPPGEPVYDADLAASRIQYNKSYTGYATTSGGSSSWKISATATMSCGLSTASYATNGYGRAKKNQQTAVVSSSSVSITC